MRTKHFLRAVWALLLCLCVFAGVALCDSGLTDAASSTGDAPREQLRIAFLNVKCADCMLIRFGEKTMLVDGGLVHTKNRILSTLRRLKIKRLDYVMATHPHADHAGGLADVMEAVEVGAFLYPDLFEGEKFNGSKRMWETIEKRKIPIQILHGGDTIPFGDVVITCYQWPHRTVSVNDRSMMLHLRYGERTALLTADLENIVMDRMVQKYGESLRAELVKMPHHGLTRCTAAFYQTVRPQMAVITNNLGNEILDINLRKLTKEGIAWRLTPWGSYEYRTDGVTWEEGMLFPN